MKREIVATNLLWRLAERCGAQGVNFIVSIVLARILMPEDYGIIALVTVFMAIMQVFVDSGLGNALIQKKDADEIDYSSVFLFNLLSCGVIYTIIFFFAPVLASFYNEEILTAVIRVLGLTVLISGVKNIQQAYVSKHMLFKRFFFSTFGGTIVSAFIGIGMALLDFGVWALVAQQLSNTLIDTIILWITVKWRPKRLFDFSRLKSLLSYGWKILFSSLLETVYNNLRSLLIAKYYTSSDLAYYNKGNQFPSFIVTNVNSAIDSVLLPTMADSQYEKARLKAIVRRSIKTSSFIIWPIMIGLAVCAKPLVIILLTEKWINCVPFLQIFCLNYAFWPIHTANLNAIKAVGRSDIFLKVEVLKKIIGIIALLSSLKYGVFSIALAFTFTAPISAIINAKPNKELFDYSIKEQIIDVFPAFGLSCVMGVIVYLVQLLQIPIIIILSIQFVVGSTFYLGIAQIMHIESFEYIKSMIKGFRRK